MAITRTAKGTASSKTSGTTLALASVALSTGDLLVVSLAYDDVALTDVVWGSETLTLGTAVLGAGVRTRLAWLVVASGGTQTITATWSANLTAKALAASSYSSDLSGAVLNADSNETNTGNGTAASTPAVSPAIVGGTDSILVASVGTEGPNGDTAGTWSTPATNGQRLGTTGSSAASNVTVSEGYELAPTAASTPALSKTGMSSRDWGAVIRAFYWEVPPTVKTGIGIIDTTGAGDAASVFTETGSGIAEGTGAASSVVIYAETGRGITNEFGGYGSKAVTYFDAGRGVLDAFGSGADAQVQTNAGYGIADFVGRGGDAQVQTNAGSGILDATGTGASAFTDGGNSASVGDIAGRTRISQAFVANNSARVNLAVMLGKTGTPADNVVVAIQADSSGAPSGTDIVSNSIAGGTLSTSTVTQRMVLYPGLTAGATYWLVIRRSGSLDAANYYLVATGPPA